MGIPLAISTLRGELADNEEWKADPARAGIVIGTIDMIGSKLLFSGYGDGPYNRAHHAGLIGQDTLIVHDEAHLTPVFSDLLRAVAEVQRRFDPRPIRIIELSATSRATESVSLGLEPEDEKDKVVHDRLGAVKRLHIHRAPNESVIRKIVEICKTHEKASAKVLVYVRTPESALEIAGALSKALGKKADERVELLTGTMRGYERDQLVKTNSMYSAFVEAAQLRKPSTWYAPQPARSVSTSTRTI